MQIFSHCQRDRIADDTVPEFSKIVNVSYRGPVLIGVRWTIKNTIVGGLLSEGILSSLLRITYQPTSSIPVVINPNNPHLNIGEPIDQLVCNEMGKEVFLMVHARAGSVAVQLTYVGYKGLLPCHSYIHSIPPQLHPQVLSLYNYITL